MNFKQRINILLKIFSIPLEEQWEFYSDKEAYTVYKYWSAMGLINQNEYNQLFIDKQLVPNIIIARFLEFFDYHFKPKYYKNGEVADIGSGFGYITFWLILSGAKKVHTIGDAKRIAFIEKLYKKAINKGLLPEKAIAFKPEFIKVNDTTLSDTISPNSLSLVLLNDTLEHITPRILPHLAKSANNDLKQGGLLISRQQNTDSKSKMEFLIPYWNKQEEQLHIKQRLKLITDKITGIDRDDAQKLAENTRGLDRVDFFQAIENFKTSSVFPKKNTKLPPIFIEIDVPDEGDTNIKRVSDTLLNNGFSKVKAYADLPHTRRLSPIRIFDKVFPKIFLDNDKWNQASVFLAQK